MANIKIYSAEPVGTTKISLTQNDADSGPVINAYRTRGAAGQANDYLGVLRFTGKNANATPEDVIYAEVVSQIKDASDSSEVGDLIFKTMRAGTLRESVRVAGSGMITLDKSHIADSVNGNILYMKGENSALYVGSTSSCLNLWGYTSAGGAGAINIDATGARTGQLYLKTNGTVGINTNVPAKRLEVVDPSAAQLRLTQDAGTKYCDHLVSNEGYEYIIPSGGEIRVQNTGGNRNRMGVITTNVPSATAKPIADINYGAFVIVYGDNGAGSVFTDTISVVGTTVNVIQSGTISGSPNTRSYDVSSGLLRLTITGGNTVIATYIAL